MLVPVSDNPFLAKDKFKRALLYGTNRESMLNGELLNSTRVEDGRLISGPFPVGIGGADPLSYAYDPEVQPTPYNPQLAKLLYVMAQRELEEAAKKTDSKPPVLEKLVVACPDFEFARVAVQAMIQQWANVGIKPRWSCCHLERVLIRRFHATCCTLRQHCGNQPPTLND